MVTSLSKLYDLTLCKKCSVSSQELTPFLMWFLWLFKRRLNPVSLLPMYCSLHVLHSMMYIMYIIDVCIYIYIYPRILRVTGANQNARKLLSLIW